ncbi:MAG: AbiEi antitoxin N-terminal domain-containing protein [Planctomycetaceae bacterium]|nr:AbiEi antitoxin N-terminal domain-containing protein [Planctomycetota bacterium]NUN52333.1 AbiEi antitoxin N-terminal domain-containing protein [Planctomycetaceae bacterium]
MERPTNRNTASPAERVLRKARRAGILRARDLAPLGIPRTYLSRLVAKGLLERVGRGLYVAAGSEPTEHHDLAIVSRRVPDGVVCLLSALRFHGLGTQVPREVWLAIAPSARPPRGGWPPIRAVRMAGEARSAGIEEHLLEGVPVRVFGAARTVADCFKFRNTVGLDAALEALREFRRGRGDLDALWRFALICRVARVLRPYLEALA